MYDSKDIAYKIIHKSFDDNVNDNIEKSEKVCSKCGAKVSDIDNYCKECGTPTQNTFNKVETNAYEKTNDLYSIPKSFLWIIISAIISCYILLSPIEFDINILGLTIHPKLKYSILEQCIDIEVGAMSFKRRNVSIADFIALKYKYFTNKRDFDEAYRNFNQN